MKKKIWRFVIILLVIILLLLLTAFFVINSKLDKISYASETVTDTVTAEPTPTPESTGDERSDLSFNMPTEEQEEDAGIVNILLLGTDFKIPGTSDPGRADCTMLCSLNKGTGEIKLISFERGIYVPISSEYLWNGASSDLLTHAYHWGGADLSQSIVSECFNLDIAGYAQVDFDSFTDVVDAIGGIDIELTDTEVYPLYQGIPVKRTITTGVNHLNGAEALVYARLRSTDDDWVRQQRQRNVIKACVNAIKDLNLSELNELADTVLPLINTNLSKSEIASLLLIAPKFLNSTISTLQVPDRNMTQYCIECDFDYESKKISNFVYGTDYELICPYTNASDGPYEGHTKEEN